MKHTVNWYWLWWEQSHRSIHSVCWYSNKMVREYTDIPTGMTIMFSFRPPVSFLDQTTSYMSIYLHLWTKMTTRYTIKQASAITWAHMSRTFWPPPPHPPLLKNCACQEALMRTEVCFKRMKNMRKLYNKTSAIGMLRLFLSYSKFHSKRLLEQTFIWKKERKKKTTQEPPM